MGTSPWQVCAREEQLSPSASEFLDEQTPRCLDPVYPTENIEFPRRLSQEKGVGTLTQRGAGAALVLH